jgi:NitT/TauT family transport system permease protein
MSTAVVAGTGRPASPPAGNQRAARRRLLAGTALLWAERLLFAVAILGLWQLFYKEKWINPALASSPVQVYHYLIDSTKDGSLWRNTSVTLEATLIAFVLASVVGILVGFGLALFPHVDRVLEPFINAFNALPRTALAPITIIYFGLGITAKVSLAFSVVVFMLLLSTRAGVKGVDRDILEYSRTVGIGRIDIIRKILFPVAIPSIFAGLRLGLVYSLLGVVTSEIVASTSGLGNLIESFSNTYNFAGVYGILLVLAVVATILNGGLSYAEKRLLRWAPHA